MYAQRQRDKAHFQYICHYIYVVKIYTYVKKYSIQHMLRLYTWSDNHTTRHQEHVDMKNEKILKVKCIITKKRQDHSRIH